MLEEKRFAVLIDADNVSAKYVKYILDEISDYGVATYKRIYGDWTKPNASSWKDVLLENSITPIQQYGYTVGKNATDAAMIIDAMDILYSGNVEGFCISSSDSDFTKLASRLRESGMIVVGMGEKKTPKPFISACNQFKYLDVLAQTESSSIILEEESDSYQLENKAAKGIAKPIEEDNKNDKSAGSSENGDLAKNMTDINVIKSTIIKMMNEIDSEDQSMNMGELGSRLVKRYPDFDVRNYGDTKLSKFLQKFDFFDIKTKGKEGTSMWVSIKTNQDKEENSQNQKDTNKIQTQNIKKNQNKRRNYKKKR
jgi:NYN domain-containing protein/OST-HTH/LOTUS domain-containing protein